MTNLSLPRITVCPKNPDAFNAELILRDAGVTANFSSEENRQRAKNFVGYFMAGSGFSSGRLEKYAKKLDEEKLATLSRDYKRVRKGRTVREAFDFVMDR